jgi:hypothetical protein
MSGQLPIRGEDRCNAVHLRQDGKALLVEALARIRDADPPGRPVHQRDMQGRL